MAKVRASSSEIDRFLEEVNRRKQQQARQAPPPMPPPVQTAPKQRQVTPPAPKMQQKVQQKQVMVADEDTFSPTVSIVQAPFQKGSSAPRPVTYQSVSIPEALSRVTESNPLQQAKALLRTSDGLRTAFILNEIFSPPNCKRRSR